MLARLPLVWLLLMAALATFAFCFAIDRWMKERKLTVVFLVISVGCCLGMIAVGGAQVQNWNARQMLVLYSFAWTGLTIGMFPTRKLLITYGDEYRHGIQREKYEYPKRYFAALLFSVILMCFLAFVLAT
ncbi:hypothetical protein [Streptomyces lasiicapitis]|uniref:Uncharacterized protein n=1 Tax=Streptomyces lasiicapitis TaxID=1923961 RepID=A0ABQ2MMV2_9ACTN|nr:hypothetical protein [Streptomyces lasiicapitis]GGO54622.1 hypothetical protein GCM10012286_64820 [Streptomyces lasiicapitis]